MPTSKEVIAAAEKRAVFVKWVDSCAAGNWMDANHAASKIKATAVVSVGYVLRDDDVELVLAQSLDDDCTNVGHVLTIPHVAVVGIWEIDQ